MPNPGFTLAEDAALKARLSHIAVTDDANAERIVKCFFRWPTGETEKQYPFITIELIDIQFDPDRAMSEQTFYYANGTGLTPEQQASHTSLYYYPSEMTEADLALDAGGGSGASAGYLSTESFVPVNLIYQVSTYARSQRHDRQMTMTLLRRVFPMRRGFIEIPEDGTIRRCEIVDWRNVNVLDQETGYKKDIHRKTFTIRITSEIPQADLLGGSRVESVQGLLTDNNEATDVLSTTFSEDF